MSDEVAKVGIGIVANDRSEAGFKSAEKRAERTQKRVGDINRRAFNDNDRATARNTKSILGSLGRIEQAAAKALGGRSMTAGLTGRLGAASAAGSAMAEGMGGAAAASSGLAAAAGAAVMAVGATVAVLGAAAYAAFKFTSSWAQGAAQLARTAEIIGVSTKALTEFSSAAERAGVDKGTAVGAVGSLSQTLNDARYGRNTQALEVLRRLGVTMKLNSDGTVDTAAMMPAIANAIQGQNSSGRRTVARALGIPEAALPAFSQGGKALSADMADSDKTGVVIDDTVGGLAKKVDRKNTLLSQTKDRLLDYAGREAAAKLADVQDGMVDGAQAFDEAVHGDFTPAVDKFGKAVDRMAAGIGGWFGGGGGGSVGRLSGGAIQQRAAHAAGFRDMVIKKYGLSKVDATALAANGELESGWNPRRKELGGGPGRGVFQVTNRKRKSLFRQTMGKDIEGATLDEQIRFAIHELKNSEAGNWDKAKALGPTSAHRAAGYSTYVERPANKGRDAAERAAVATAMDHIPVKLDIRLTQDGKLKSVKSTVGAGPAPAVSHAMTNTPAFR